MTIAPWGGSRAIYRIVVRDLLLMCRIGIYEHERLAPQRVRINVDLAVAETVSGTPDSFTSDDIANVYNYEDVVKGAKAVIAQRHIDLVETLAEEIAAHCLQDPRVEDVKVRVEKLDVYAEAESVGIEIVRRQTRHEGAFTPPAALVYLDGQVAVGPHLRSWLDRLAAQPLVVVTGAGPLAPSILTLQAQMGLGVNATHHMMLMAMAQMGRMVVDLEPRLQPVSTLAELRATLKAGRTAVWLPHAEAGAVEPAHLAVHLARQIKARRLIVVGNDQITLPGDGMDLVMAGAGDAAITMVDAT